MDSDVLKLVVRLLGAISLFCICGMVLLAAVGKEPPSALVSTAAVAAGALAGILASQREK